MQIGSFKTPKGQERVTLQFWSTQRKTGRQYPRRTLRLTRKEYAELFNKVLELASVGQLASQFAHITGKEISI